MSKTGVCTIISFTIVACVLAAVSEKRRKKEHKRDQELMQKVDDIFAKVLSTL